MTQISIPTISKLKPIIKIRQAGFTLLEVLIAMTIAALMISVATIAFGDNDMAKLKTKARQLYGLIQVAQEESIIRGVELGVYVEPQRYSFMIYNGGKWQPLEDHRLLHEINFDEPIKAYVNIEGQESLLENEEPDEDEFSNREGRDEETSEQGDDDNNKKAKTPQIYMLSSGEMSEFAMTIGLDRDEPVFYRVTGNYVGDIKLSSAIAGHFRHDWDKDLEEEDDE